ncbi:hypothetical protein [Priestia endophytica]|uniref:Uncharacterized protein n=1 Tax=Priestia endophytica DSM 13796 TaxID=1121089 RepID=A0A1I6C0L6_9BACI|nr:hypothetical protein [Priestia endophytica]KYG33425.1 hypothetical protein AZF06_21510 [Priestia endophytica]SFQ86694.1 hypothetical protein SAMN02745910_04701 [Priestia endophytica DSM 13796]
MDILKPLEIVGEWIGVSVAKFEKLILNDLNEGIATCVILALSLAIFTLIFNKKDSYAYLLLGVTSGLLTVVFFQKYRDSIENTSYYNRGFFIFAILTLIFFELHGKYFRKEIIRANLRRKREENV